MTALEWCVRRDEQMTYAANQGLLPHGLLGSWRVIALGRRRERGQKTERDKEHEAEGREGRKKRTGQRKAKTGEELAGRRESGGGSSSVKGIKNSCKRRTSHSSLKQSLGTGEIKSRLPSVHCQG